ncbi:hypothetical protein PGTUg99_007003 [Puccinia graminis f. sp. tritici]|uniref:IPO4/5-like TPR repeats domain-containing protein n=1 Tax=Puccinia graminis f. sp. tritici TaxID=56615 RepID=A0A5B0R517_PUCGR|nr:hypothetical protein PGTUg99_007003 [Puccinia graminis f. sp. tritici]
MRDAIKVRLLEIVVSEPLPITQHAIARVISEVAEYELPEKAWPQLLGFLIKATDSPVAHERDVAIFTLSSLIDTVVDSYAENLPQIYALFAKTLQDPESLEVRVTTVQALGRVAEYIEVDEEASIAMIPQMLVVIGQTLEGPSTVFFGPSSSRRAR